MGRHLSAALVSFLLAAAVHAFELQVDLGLLETGFEANEGQISRSEVRYVWRRDGVVVLLHPGGIELSTPGGDASLSVVGGASDPLLVGARELPGRRNYFRGCHPEDWRTGIRRYGRVTYRDVYPGVDLVFHSDRDSLEFDLVLEPGVGQETLDRIELAVEGAAHLCREEAGDLVLAVSGGEVRMHRPLVQELGPAGPHALPARFEMRGERRIGFEVDGWDPSRGLIIDPVLTFSTFLGGGGNDVIVDMALDATGMVYVMGTTDSLDFPLVSPLQSSCPTCETDLFVSKIDPNTSTLVYSTYLGGSDYESAGGMAVDGAGRVYLAGGTRSSDFPVVAALQPYLNGHEDAFVARLGSTGSSLDFSTYLGGSNSEMGYDLALGPNQEPVIVGDTDSADFPTVSPLQPNLISYIDAFLTKLTPDGSGIVYSTYLDADYPDWFQHAVDVDAQGNAVVGLVQDLKVLKIDPAGTSLIYETPLCPYYCDGYYSPRIDVAMDGAGRAHVVWRSRESGQQVSLLDPSGSILYERTYGYDWELDAIAVGSGDDTWVAGSGSGELVCSLPHPGSGLLAHLDGLGYVDSLATSIGGGDDSVESIALGASGSVYIAGITGSPLFPLVAPVQSTHGGGWDGFVARVDPSGLSPPSARFGASPTYGKPPLEVTFGPSSTCSTTTGFLWDFGDGATSSLVAPTHTYTSLGLYTVSLTTTNAAGSTTWTRVDYIDVCDIAVDFSATPREGAPPLTVEFTSDVSGTARYYRWDFGDGFSSSDVNPTHTFSSEGVFDVSLSVYGGPGICHREVKKKEYIATFRPDFEATPRAGIAPLSVQFLDRSVGAIQSWIWDFGDGATSSQRNPTHTYSGTGRYDVSLSAATPSTAATEARPEYILVSDQPVADIVTGPGADPSAPARVLSFDALGGPHAATDLLAYGVSGYGANVGLGNLDGVGRPEIVTGPGPGVVFGPQVRAFTPTSIPVAKVNFYAYGTLRYGVQAMGARVDGDAAAEILTGPGPGAVFGPHLRGWNFDGAVLAPLPNLSAFVYGTLKYGLNVGRGDFYGDAVEEILTAPGPGPNFAPEVRGFRYGASLSELPGLRFWAFSTIGYGARADGGEVDGTRLDEILVGMGAGPGNYLRVSGFSYDGSSVQAVAGLHFFHSGLFGAEAHAGDVDGDGKGELVVSPGPDPATGARVLGVDYESQKTTQIPPDFAPYSWFYGVHVATGDLGL